jgi:hypothetical protein
LGRSDLLAPDRDQAELKLDGANEALIGFACAETKELGARDPQQRTLFVDWESVSNDLQHRDAGGNHLAG